jgi:thiol-disulfide isomerase/thioredoxin
VSQSPVTPEDFAEARSSESRYRQSLATLNELLRHGGTLSGHEANCAFLNLHGGPFATVSSVAGFDYLDDARGMALADWDSDGDVDIFTSNRTAPRLRFLRNELPQSNHFLAVHLEGRSCNRDAIGARVEVVDRTAQGRCIKSLRAGEGYLSQSSKWMTFGLGPSAAAVDVTVHWPDGTTDRHAGVPVDQHYQLVQGERVARTWRRPASDNEAQLAIRPGPLELPAPTARARVPLVQRIPLPRLPLGGVAARTELPDSTASSSESAESTSGRPRLINLWATWCGPCLQELGEIAQRAAELRAVSLDVLAINVDAVVPEQAENAPDPAALLTQLQFPFATAVADDETIRRLQTIHELPFAVHVDLSVPTSLLLDHRGRVAVIYRGAVSVDQLLADVELLKFEGERWLEAALPLPGRWNETPSPRLTLRVARELLERRDLDATLDYVTRFRQDLQEVEQFASLLVALGDELLADRRTNEGLSQYSAALEVDSQHVLAMNNLAWQLATNRDPAARNGELAVRWAERATRLTRARDVGILDTLAACYAEAGRFPDAIRAAERAIRLAEPAEQGGLVERIERRLEGYRDGRPFRSGP